MEKKRTQQSGRREKKWEQQAQEVEAELLGGGRTGDVGCGEMTTWMMVDKGS